MTNSNEGSGGLLPGLHDAASGASLEAQQTYLRLAKLDLASLVLGALLTTVSFQRVDTIQWVAAVGALLLVAGLILTGIISAKNYEQRWYGGRAAAESVKTLAWRYMAGAEPFETSLDPKEADDRFLRQLTEILDQSDQLALQLGGPSASRNQITNKMREVRILPLAERRVAYLRERVDEQRQWYANKAEANHELERKYFFAIMGLQFLAVAAALVIVVRPRVPVNLSGLLAAAAAALIAWLQVKRHQELAQSYGVAAHELGLVAEQARYATTEEDFSVFVADAESAISREHTLWVARRDVPGRRRRGRG